MPPRRNVPFVDDFVPGEALSIRSARIKVGHVEDTVSVVEGDLCKTFQMPLKKGRTQLETFFTDANGVVRRAYYVYVRLLENTR